MGQPSKISQGSGTSMTLKLVISLDSEDEDIAVSNLVVTCVDAAPTC